jgi:hypothetical protein
MCREGHGFIWPVASESKDDEKELPDQDWDRRPVLVVRKQDRRGLARAKCRDEVPLVIEEVLVAGEVQEADKGDAAQAKQGWEQPSRSNVTDPIAHAE